MSERPTDARIAELARPARPGELRQTDDACTAREVQVWRTLFDFIDIDSVERVLSVVLDRKHGGGRVRVMPARDDDE